MLVIVVGVRVVRCSLIPSQDIRRDAGIVVVATYARRASIIVIVVGSADRAAFADGCMIAAAATLRAQFLLATPFRTSVREPDLFDVNIGL